MNAINRTLLDRLAPATGSERTPGAAFGDSFLPGRPLDPGMGVAVARRTVFRLADHDDFGRVADRVAAGNLSLLGSDASNGLDTEYAHLRTSEYTHLRNAIATGALITSGRHLQHGDADQATRNIEVFTNCATAIASFVKFYLLLNGSGVGRAYDDDLIVVDWADAPRLVFHLSPTHPDYPMSADAKGRFARDLGLAPSGVDAFLAANLLGTLADAPEGATVVGIGDSREGWAEAVERLESMAFRRETDRVLVLDFSAIRPCGAPIAGMQGRPASGPISLLRAFLNIRDRVIEPARLRDPHGEAFALWEQAMLVDHYLSVEVQVGGARRAARMATKSWRDPGVLRFIRSKSEGGLWTANNSVMVDRTFWRLLEKDPGAANPLASHAHAVFDEATRCGYINGEPGFINGDALEDHRTGAAWRKPIHTDGRDVRSARYQVREASGLMGELSRRAASARFPVTTNPCGEIALHVTGGYCVIADFAPLLACPLSFDAFEPGLADSDAASLWDARVFDSVRLGVRFLMRANRMDALYSEEVRRTNRIGIGPTGLHEWAWTRFGLGFRDLLDERRSAPFWSMLARLSEAAKQEAELYAAELGQAVPATITTVKPAGTTSKLFGLTEGAHLPARRQYLRWVQFRGEKDEHGAWRADADPLLADYEAKGYPLRALTSFPGMTIVGFPTEPLAQRLGMGDALVTALEATPAEQYHWLRLLERHWIGADRGNQVSYTLKLYTDRIDLDAFRDIIRREQPRVRACAVLPSRPDSELGYEYLPEEDVSPERFAAITARIAERAAEVVDLAELTCAAGVCPI